MPQLDGLLLIDKPADLTSHDVVGRLRKLLKQKTVGHTGTLDPIATGLMVIVLGDATKLSDYLMAEDKEYIVDARLGVTTDTLDRVGQVLSTSDRPVFDADLRAACEDLEGEFEWPVPIYSAKKVDGEKLCDAVRRGDEVEAPLKQMAFFGIEVLETTPQSARVRVACSKGSFIRTWVSQLGQALGVGAIVNDLRRTRVGGWSVDQAVTLEDVARRVETGEVLGPAFIPMSQALPGLKSVLAGPKEARLVGHGQIPRDLGARLIYEQKQAYEKGQPVFVKVVSADGELLAILAAEPQQGLKIRRVFRQFA